MFNVYVKLVKDGYIHPFTQIKKCICEVVGTNYYALVNQTEHPLNKLSPHYTPVQLELFKRIVEEVVTSESGTVTSIQVLNFEFDETGEFMVYFE